MKHCLSKKDIVELLTIEKREEICHLYQIANQVRKKYVGNEVHLRGIIEFSNYCRRDCLYCGLRKSNRDLHFYGRLGRKGVCILFKKGTKIHSDLDGIMRIEFDDSVEEKILDVEKELKEVGFKYITLDLEGYRSGSMDEVL